MALYAIAHSAICANLTFFQPIIDKSRDKSISLLGPVIYKRNMRVVWRV